MKYLILFLLLHFRVIAGAQQIDSIYVNLYTDSLKKGTLNYINIDGRLSNGTYLPLDSTKLIFYASAGKFSGNCLWIDNNFGGDKINVKVTLRDNRALFKEFEMYIKKKPDNEKLKSADEILDEMKNEKRSKKRRN